MRKVFGYMFLILAFFATVSLRFSNIDMTETRLFVAFWPAWILIAMCAVLGGLLVAEKRK